MKIYLITSYHEMKSAKQTHRIHTRPKIGLRDKIYTYICTTQLVDTTEKQTKKLYNNKSFQRHMPPLRPMPPLKPSNQGLTIPIFTIRNSNLGPSKAFVNKSATLCSVSIFCT